MMALRKDYATSRAGILKYVELGLSAVVLILSGVTAKGLFSFIAVAIVGVCFVGCITIYVMRLFDCVQHQCEFYFLVAAAIGMLAATIVILYGSSNKVNEEHKTVFIISGLCSLVVCVLYCADLVIGKWFSGKQELGAPPPPAAPPPVGGEKITKGTVSGESDQPPKA